MKKYLIVLLASLGLGLLLLTSQTVQAVDNDDAAATNQTAPMYTGLKKVARLSVLGTTLR